MPVFEIKYSRKRISNEDPVPVTNPNLAEKYLKRFCFKESESWRETVYALYLDKNRTPVGHLLIGLGAGSTVTVDERLLIKGALDTGASSVVLSHNHPSGNVKPSTKDVEETKRLKKALDCFGISLADHIIIGNDTFYSFSDDKELITTAKHN